MTHKDRFARIRHLRPYLESKVEEQIEAENGFLNQYGEVRTTERTPIIEIKSNHPFSDLRDRKITSGSGDVTNTIGDGEYRVFTTANGTDSARLESNEYGRYIPGYDAEGGIGVRIPTLPTGNIDAKWGLFNADGGLFYGVDATGFYVGIRRNGSTTIIRQSDFNGDKLDGTGDSGLTLDLARGNIFQITFSWYGYGVINFDVILPDDNIVQRKITIHSFAPHGETSIKDPDLQVAAEVDNNGTATAFDLFVGGRSYQIVGPFRPRKRIVSAYRIQQTVGSSFVPLVSFRSKSNFESISIEIEGIDILSDASLIFEIRADASLTGASFGTPGDHNSSETATEADISATSMTGGNPLYTGLVLASGAGGTATGSANVSRIDFSFPDSVGVTLAARRVSGTGATVTSCLRVNEEW